MSRRRPHASDVAQLLIEPVDGEKIGGDLGVIVRRSNKPDRILLATKWSVAYLDRDETQALRSKLARLIANLEPTSSRMTCERERILREEIERINSEEILPRLRELNGIITAKETPTVISEPKFLERTIPCPNPDPWPINKPKKSVDARLEFRLSGILALIRAHGEAARGDYPHPDIWQLPNAPETKNKIYVSQILALIRRGHLRVVRTTKVRGRDFPEVVAPVD